MMTGDYVGQRTFDCGCNFTVFANECRWEPCPAHKAAFDMREALEEALPFLLQHAHGPGPCKPICWAGIRVVAAIARARG